MLGDFRPAKSRALLIPSGTSADPGKHHLFFLLTNPCPAGFHLAVSISTIKPGRANDTTCLIAAGEHPFVEADSFVMYSTSRQLHRNGIIKCVAGRIYTPKDDCSAGLIKRVCEGVQQSAFTPRWVKKYFADNSHR